VKGSCKHSRESSGSQDVEFLTRWAIINFLQIARDLSSFSTVCTLLFRATYSSANQTDAGYSLQNTDD